MATNKTQSEHVSKTNLAELIWKNAEVLTGAFKPNDYRKVILPMMVMRRLDCLLASTKVAALAMADEVKKSGFQASMFMPGITKYPFWNTSRFSFATLIEDPDNLKDNLADMIEGFSPNVARVFDKFGFMATVEKLHEKKRLYLVVKNFAQTPMDMQSVSAHDMGRAFEELLRKFNEGSPSDEQYTPRDAIHLMVDMLFDGDDEALSIPGAIRTMYDQTAGTGGMLSEAEEKVRLLNPNAKLKLFGQELEDETYAICMADMLIRDQDPANIALGDTLGDDKHPNERFDYQLSNPPYGREWKPSEESVKREHDKGAAGRFGAGFPRIGDGQMLFQLNALSKMRPYINGEGGGKIGIVHNGSPLFTGDAGGGESEIRRFILENDYLDTIVALPTDMFYNTGIQTFLWFMSNRKPKERKGKVMLIDAAQMGVLMKKNMGKKRIELSEDCQLRILQAYHDYAEVSWTADETVSGRKRALQAKIFANEHFMYRKVTIERPLRMRFQIDGHPSASIGSAHKEGSSGTFVMTGSDVEQLEDLLESLWFGDDPLLKKLPTAECNSLIDAIKQLQKVAPNKIWMTAEDFRSDIQDADNFCKKLNKEKPSKLKAKQFELARKLFGIRDNKAEITTNEKGDSIPDAELRDAEYIPFSVIGNNVEAGIQSYFDAEVKPHWSDAWINTEVKDLKDRQIGLVGVEINFNREFYVYKSLRQVNSIEHDIRTTEEKFASILNSSARVQSYDAYKKSSLSWLSDVPTHWEVNLIKRGFEVTLGKMLQPEQKIETEFLAPYLRSANVQWETVDTSDIQKMWFNPKEAGQLSLQPGDLILCEGGDAGRAAIWAGEIDGCFFQNSVNRIRSAGGNDTKYLLYWMSLIKSGGYVDIICNKATIAHLRML
jgi:type I restriction enzyme M protein